MKDTKNQQKLEKLIQGRPEREYLAQRLKAFGVDMESIIEVMENLDEKVGSRQEKESIAG